MEIGRYLTEGIVSDLSEKMVFVGGARQVGKITSALRLVTREIPDYSYYNWDFPPDRKRLMNLELPGGDALIIFDEIRKYRKWKGLVKRIYDSYKAKYRILIAGSAKLNIYRKGGDSLQGRYHYYTLHPFSVAELRGSQNVLTPLGELPIPPESVSGGRDSFEVLWKFGGFPEMVSKQSERSLRRWHNEKLERLFREDIRDMENLQDIASVKLLSDMLPSKVASQLSVNSIREDLEVSHKAATKWLDILEQFYYHFRIYPWQGKAIRSIKKEPKLYLIDWSEVENEGSRFENIIASHLLKMVQYLTESEGYRTTLNYLRNVDKKEVDFLVAVGGKPWFAVEAKVSDTRPSPNLTYYGSRLKIPNLFQVVKGTGVDVMRDGVRVISADRFLSGLI